MNKNNFLTNFLSFLHESEGLKKLLRHSWLSNGRRESVAEHSWRLSLMAMVLTPRMKDSINLEKVMKMVAVHDLGEVYAGDHWAFRKTLTHKYKVEKDGLKKIVRKLPKDTQKELILLWEEYEEKNTKEAKFAQALDKLEVLIQHNEADLKTWNKEERTFNLTYGDDKCDYDELIGLLREVVRKETKTKLRG